MRLPVATGYRQQLSTPPPYRNLLREIVCDRLYLFRRQGDASHTAAIAVNGICYLGSRPATHAGCAVAAAACAVVCIQRLPVQSNRRLNGGRRCRSRVPDTAVFLAVIIKVAVVITIMIIVIIMIAITVNIIVMETIMVSIFIVIAVTVAVII